MTAKHGALFRDARDIVAAYGIQPDGMVYRNLNVDALYQVAVASGQAVVLGNGALLQDTSPYFGRAAKSSFYVRDPDFRMNGKSLDDLIAWGNPAVGEFDNLPISPEVFHRLSERVRSHLCSDGDVYVTDAVSGRTASSRLHVRLITSRPASALFAHNIFISATDSELEEFEPGWTILHAPDVCALPEDGTNGDAFVITHLGLRTTIIGGTRYHGQIKKSIFCVQNFLLPLRGILTMHAGASEGRSGRSAIHAGLSGTGKTTLSNTGFPVADDQIVVEVRGEGDAVISNMEGGQYAKTDKLSVDKEPETFHAIGYGTTAENLSVGEDGQPKYDDASITANGRVGYPLAYVPTAKSTGCAPAPSNITFLTADGYGVLPPVARLTVEAGMYHFAAGFTSKMPGTEKGVTEPRPTFSSFFGKPFMPLKPAIYMDLLRELIEVHGTDVWLVNTGWLGPHTPDRRRVDIMVSKAIIHAIRDGGVSLDPDNYWFDPVFKLHVPKRVEGVPSHILDPKNAWDSAASYHHAAQRLAEVFQEGVSHIRDMPAEILQAGPAPLVQSAFSPAGDGSNSRSPQPIA
jgi:phosphoenolpyruvate carboxykinase (ATP)